MTDPDIQPKTQVIALAHRCAARGWTPATAGNFSVRGPSGQIAITRSGADKGNLTEADILLLPLDECPPPEASAEAPLHWALYRANSRTHAVAHCHTPAAALISLLPAAQNGLKLAGWELLKALRSIDTHESEIIIPVLPNTQDMAGLSQKLEFDDIVPALLLQGHGIYAWGSSADEAFRHLEALDHMFDLELRKRSLAI